MALNRLGFATVIPRIRQKLIRHCFRNMVMLVWGKSVVVGVELDGVVVDGRWERGGVKGGVGRDA